MRHIPPPVWMMLSIVLMILINNQLPVLIIFEPPITQIGYVVIGISLLYFGWSVRQFFLSKTTLIPFHESTALISSGPFRFSRNPIYLSMLLILIGVAIRLGTFSPLVIVVAFWFVINQQFIRKEEQMLEKTFGEKYRLYCEKTRRWL